MSILFAKECEKWVDYDKDPYKFSRWLLRNKWKNINPKFGRGMWKYVFSKNNIVVKFDQYPTGGNQTLSEYMSWVKSSNKRKNYICPPLLYYSGILFQPLLSNVCDNMYIVPDKVHRLARRYRFSHFWNYGYLNGKIKFFDTDGLYYKLTDKEERK